jgi:RNA polymerase subunit RPABC4/transcription elongation factor Spt4
MEKEIFQASNPLMYCPNCAATISRKATACPQCRQKVFKQSRWPIVGLVVGGAFSLIAIIGIVAAVSIPAYQTYKQRAEAAQADIEWQDNDLQPEEKPQ